MHHIYHTDAIVISAENSGEADKTFLLYTKELGFIYAKAQGIRLEKSKLRFALQPYTLARIALVKGKAQWRLTTATPVAPLFSGTAMPAIEFFRNIVGLLKDLVPQEVPDTRIFEDLRNAFLYVSAAPGQIKVLKSVELCLMLRVLFYLGYIPKEEGYNPVLEENFSFYRFPYETLPQKQIIQAINKTLSETTH